MDDRNTDHHGYICATDVDMASGAVRKLIELLNLDRRGRILEQLVRWSNDTLIGLKLVYLYENRH